MESLPSERTVSIKQGHLTGGGGALRWGQGGGEISDGFDLIRGHPHTDLDKARSALHGTLTGFFSAADWADWGTVSLISKPHLVGTVSIWFGVGFGTNGRQEDPQN